MVNDSSIVPMQFFNLQRSKLPAGAMKAMFYVRGASFWQQNQAWRNRSSANQQDLDVVTAVTSKMSSALTSLSTGLSSIANQRALTRVQAQIKAATAAAAGSATKSSRSNSSSSSRTTGTGVNKIA
jgi:response regulator of citrate/malate metabolism